MQLAPRKSGDLSREGGWGCSPVLHLTSGKTPRLSLRVLSLLLSLYPGTLTLLFCLGQLVKWWLIGVKAKYTVDCIWELDLPVTEGPCLKLLRIHCGHVTGSLLLCLGAGGTYHCLKFPSLFKLLGITDLSTLKKTGRNLWEEVLEWRRERKISESKPFVFSDWKLKLCCG